MNICQWQPAASASAGVCEHCAHAVVCHVGVKQCTVCYQVAVTRALQSTVMELALQLRRMADGIRDHEWPNL